MSAILEIVMLIAFSVSWHCSILKMVRTRRASGKSLIFVLLITFGYLCGAGAKLVAWAETGVHSPLVWLYIYNGFVTALDAWMVVHFTRRENRGGGRAEPHLPPPHSLPAE